MKAAMHHSRLAGFIIDCKDTAPDAAAEFWSAALGMPSAGDDGDGYAKLDASAHDLNIEVQRVKHESRIHLDLHTDDEAAEVARLERLGAKKLHKAPRWTIMEAPTGHRFCVISTTRALAGLPGTNRWP